MRKNRASQGTLFLVAALLVSSPAAAGESGNDGKEPKGGSKGGAGWNPSIECTVQAEDTSWLGFMECLASAVVAGGGTDSDEFEIEIDEDNHRMFIHANGGIEIERLLWWEDDPNIQMNYIEVLRPGLSGRIGVVKEKPSKMGGLLLVEVNRIPLPAIQTGLYNKASKVTDALVDLIRDAGYMTVVFEDYIYILQVLGTGEGITHIRWESTDPAIVSCDLAVLPFAEALVAAEPNN